jgi:NADP-dependent 3-hydroxy acid dehydrogenase YdfG
VYEGIRPLRGDDIARTILWAVTQPPHVNIDEIVVTPVSQANSYYNKKEM